MSWPGDFASQFDILDTQYGREALDRLVDAMLCELRQLGLQPSSGHTRLWARHLLVTCRSSLQMYHFGAEDRKNLRRVSKAADDAVSALHLLSPWAAQALGTAMRQGGNGHEIPSSVFRHIADAAKQAEAMTDKGPVQGRINWEAVSIVGEARRCWQDLSGDEPPERALNEATPFGEFLYAIFQALELDANPKAAFLSWRKREDEQIRH